MNPVNLISEAHTLPHWRSAIVARVGGVNVKIERMNAEPQPAETHDDFAEALVVLEGRLELDCDGTRVSIGEGEMFVVPMKTPHQVVAGSEGILLIVNMLPGATAPWLA